MKHFAERDSTVTFGQPASRGTKHQRHVHVVGSLNTQKPREIRLPGCGGKQIPATNHLVNTLECVVDHHGQVVRPIRSLPAAAKHHVIHVAGVVTREKIVHGPLRYVGTKS